MPEGYTNMRDKFIKDGMSAKEAKKKAARIWNAKHPNNPVGKGKHESDQAKILDGESNVGTTKILTED